MNEEMDIFLQKICTQTTPWTEEPGKPEFIGSQRKTQLKHTYNFCLSLLFINSYMDTGQAFHVIFSTVHNSIVSCLILFSHYYISTIAFRIFQQNVITFVLELPEILFSMFVNKNRNTYYINTVIGKIPSFQILPYIQVKET